MVGAYALVDTVDGRPAGSASRSEPAAEEGRGWLPDVIGTTTGAPDALNLGGV